MTPTSFAPGARVVAATRRIMQKYAQDQWPSRFNRLRRRAPLAQPVFTMEVGRRSLDRTVQLLQAFVTAVVDLGGDIDTSNGDVPTMQLLGEFHRLRLRERVQRHREVSTGGGTPAECWRPTGTLELHLEAASTGELLAKWTDGTRGTLEAQLRTILVEFVKQVQSTRTKNTARRHAEERTQQERDARRRAAEQAERARHRVGVLEGLAARHAAFVSMTQLLRACAADGAVSVDLAQWLQTAEAAAAQLNPLARGPQHLRDIVEKQIDEKMIGWHYYDWRMPVSAGTT